MAFSGYVPHPAEAIKPRLKIFCRTMIEKIHPPPTTTTTP
jgi:hypothetical protein